MCSFNPIYYTYEKTCKDNVKMAGGRVLKGEEYFDPDTISLKQVRKICTETLNPILYKRPRSHLFWPNSHPKGINFYKSHSSFVGLYVFEGLSPSHGKFIKIGRTTNLDSRLRTYSRKGETIRNLTLFEVVSSVR